MVVKQMKKACTRARQLCARRVTFSVHRGELPADVHTALQHFATAVCSSRLLVPIGTCHGDPCVTEGLTLIALRAAGCVMGTLAYSHEADAVHIEYMCTSPRCGYGGRLISTFVAWLGGTSDDIPADAPAPCTRVTVVPLLDAEDFYRKVGFVARGVWEMSYELNSPKSGRASPRSP